MRFARLVVCTLLLGNACLASPSTPGAPDQTAIAEAVKWAQATPRIQSEFNYEMTCRLRLLLFWASKDDLGGGFIKIGRAADDPSLQMIQLAFGSDPAKAPRAINRWGAGTEVIKSSGGRVAESSVFVGFMKSSKGDSVSSMQRELSSEKHVDKHLFEAIISRADRTQAVATTVSFASNTDYNMFQLADAQKQALDQLGDDQQRKFRHLEGSAYPDCGGPGGLLLTTQDLVERALQGEKPPLTHCYIYNARRYTLTLQRVAPVAAKDIHLTLKDKSQKMDRSYRNLLESRFQILNQESGVKTDFSMLLGTSGELRGVPVQISYQPNWWFQVVLNLR